MGSAASSEATKAISSASVDELRQCLEGLSAEDAAKLREVLKNPADPQDGTKKPGATMAGVFQGTNGNGKDCVLQLDVGSKAMVRYSDRDDCSDAGGPDLLKVTYVYGRWKQVEHHGNLVALIQTSSMKTGNDDCGSESNIKDWKAEPLKGILVLGGLRENRGGVLAPCKLHPTIEPMGRMFQSKEPAACSMESDADYGGEDSDFDVTPPTLELAGKFANGDDSRIWYLHPKGGFRQDFKYAMGVRTDLGSWTPVYGNIVEITTKKTKDCDETKEESHRQAVFVDEGKLQDTSTMPTFSRKEASVDDWPSMDDF